MTNDMKNTIRKHWFNFLIRLPEERITAAAESMLAGWQLHHISLPRSGLALLDIRDGALGEDFYMGEYPLARAHIELRNDQGDCFQGGAVAMADSVSHVVALAVCDAVYANRLAGWQEVAALVEEGVAITQCDMEVRRSILARTRVNFSLLEAADGTGEDHDESC